MNVNDKAALTVDIDEFDEFFAAVNHGREPYACLLYTSDAADE